MSKKVYELAQELGFAPLDMVEKLKSLGFNVRNHMAALTDDEVGEFMVQLGRKKEHPKALLRKGPAAPKLSQKLEGVKEKLIRSDAEKEFQERLSAFQETLNAGPAALLKKYSSYGVLSEAKFLKQEIPQYIKDICHVHMGKKNYEVPVYAISVSFRDFTEKRKEQLAYQIQRNKNEDIQTQGVKAEIAFEKLLRMRNLNYTDLNLNGFDSRQDFLVENRLVDVKSKKTVKHWIDKSLASGYTGADEIIAFMSYENSRGIDSYCELVGMYDPKLIPQDLVPGNDRPPFYNPCMFVDFDSYFGCKKVIEYPVLEKVVSDFIFSENSHESFWKLIAYYGPEQVLKVAEQILPEYHELLERVKENFILGPVILFNWIIENIRAKKKLDDIKIKTHIFPLCGLNSFQEEYLNLLLRTAESLPKYRCMKYRDIPLTEGIIEFRRGILSVRVRSDGPLNTIMGYSRLDGRLISILKNERCECGCLLHDGFRKGEKIGKRSCPFHGDGS